MTEVPLAELAYFVRNVLATVHMSPKTGRAFVLALQGDLGAGKTTFVQAFAKELGVTGILQSPTYVLMKSYDVPPDSHASDVLGRQFTKLVHIDAYRLEKPEQFTALRPEEFLQDPGTLVCVEWPEKIKGVLPDPDLVVRFSADTTALDVRNIELV